MSERSQTLMRTRCPACETVFRVTSEQLRQRAGKVRCGHCQFVFNAFDQLVPDEAVVPQLPLADGGLQSEIRVVEHLADPPGPSVVDHEADVSSALHGNELMHVRPPESGEAEQTDLEVLPRGGRGEALADSVLPIPASPLSEEVPLAELVVAPEVPMAAADLSTKKEEEAVVVAADEIDLSAVPPGLEGGEPVPSEIAVEESLEESTQAARDAGLVAVRELVDPVAYNRWAEGALAGNRLGSIGDDVQKRPVWPFVMVALLLLLALLAQLGVYYRTEISVRYPFVKGLYDSLAIEIPLPRNADLITIESSDLQSDVARGLFVLQATIKNRAPFAQAWPVLELSLTDVNDNVVSRRAMYAAEYLPPGTPAESFVANEELGVRLWVEAKGIGAAGYRVYLFYP